MSIEPTPQYAEDPDIAEFRRAVEAAAPPELEVLPAEGGFDVQYRERLLIDGAFHTVESGFWAHVRCNPETLWFTLEDRGRVEYTRPGMRASRGQTRGRAYRKSTVTTYAVLPDGSMGSLGTATQDTRVIHQAVREPAAQLQWVEREPASVKIGKTFFFVGLFGGALTLVTLAVLALTGQLN